MNGYWNLINKIKHLNRSKIFFKCNTDTLLVYLQNEKI